MLDYSFPSHTAARPPGPTVRRISELDMQIPGPSVSEGPEIGMTFSHGRIYVSMSCRESYITPGILHILAHLHLQSLVFGMNHGVLRCVSTELTHLAAELAR